MTHTLYTMYIPKNPVHPYMRLRERLLEVVDGLTESPVCLGAWRNSAGEHVQEGVAVITVMVQDVPETSSIEYLLEQYKAEAEQSCVLYTTQQVNAVFI